LGEILTGETIYNSNYVAALNKDLTGTYCQFACKKKIRKEYDFTLYRWVIEQEYNAYFYADALPAGLNQAYLGEINKINVIQHEGGIPVGKKVFEDEKTRYKVFNHFTFIISLHKSQSHSQNNDNLYYVVEFNIIPYR
jgi:hypothetical protein